MTSIYRFERLGYFDQALRDKKLTFVPPFKWPDRNEGLLFRQVFSRGKMEEVRIAAQEMFQSVFPEQDFGTAIADLLTVLRTTRLAQCWSKCEGNSHLWHDKDIRIEIHREDTLKLDGVEVRDV